MASCDKNPVSSGELTDQWVALNSGLGSLYVQCIALHPQVPTTVYAATYGGVYVSTNAGEDWRQLGAGITSEDIKCVAVSPHTPEVILCGTWGDGIFKSTDAGVTWSPQSQPFINPRINEIEFDRENPDLVYVASADKMYKSEDLGDTWMELFSYGNVRSVAIHPTASNILFVGVEYHGIFKSENGGVDWSPASNGLFHTDDGYAGPCDIALDPLSPDFMYAATNAVDIFKSENCGSYWSLKDSGLDYRKARKLAFDPRNTDIIYAATNRGVMYSTNRGDFWQLLDDGAGIEGVRAITMNYADQRTLYAGCFGGGFYRYVWSN
jgi:photosystem II stability/assembly factor-like uncharacterized protein